jgi:hypothetical protein
MGMGVGSLVVVIVIMLHPDRHPLPSPTTAATTKPHIVVRCPYVIMCCSLHLSSLCCCVSLLCEPPSHCCCWRSLCFICCCCTVACCVGARYALCVVAALCAVIVVGPWWWSWTELTQHSFFGRRGYTTATYLCHRYGSQFGYPYPYLWLNPPKTRGYTRTLDVH